VTIAQFGRSFRLQVGGLEVNNVDSLAALRVEFKIERDKRRDPDTASFIIYNLNPEHRADLESQAQVSCVFDAGYKDNVQQMFAGILRRAVSFKQGGTWATSIKVGDGESPKIALARLNKTYAKGTPISAALQDLVQLTEIKSGNLSELIDAARIAGQDKWLRAKTISGPPMSELYRLARSFGFGYTIQDGVFVFHSDTSSTGAGVILSPDTGLIEVPKLDSKGNVQFKALLTADILPQALVELRSESVSGKYVVQKTEHAGDSAGGDWCVSGTGKPYKS